MRLLRFEGPLPPRESEAYQLFEAAFCYPLGPGRTFRISHQRDPHRFFAAMGPSGCISSACILAEDDHGVCGSGAISIRKLLLPDGRERAVAYLGDLKIAERSRGSTCLVRIARELESWGRKHADAAVGIVMDGTERTPLDYTGRAGIPPFSVLGRVVVFLLSGSTGSQRVVGARQSGRTSAEAAFRKLSFGRFAAIAGEPPLRSSFDPVWLCLEPGSAWGCLEDTRRAKRLIADDGREILCAHLSWFAFETPESGADLARFAVLRARDRGLDRLFVSVASEDAPGFRAALSDLECVEARATIYGVGLDQGFAWNVNTSEI